MKVIFLASILLGSTYAGLVNLDNFDPIVEKVNSLKTSWNAENKFGPHVAISYLKPFMGVIHSDHELPMKGVINEFLDLLVLPNEFDARKKWPHCPTISQIRDQGTCGSCWAVAAAGAMSDRMCIISNGTFTEPISAEELLSCCKDCGNGCKGGEPKAAWSYFMTSGLVTGGEYKSNIGCQPYTIQPCEHHTNGPLPNCSSLSLSDTPQCQKTCTNPSTRNFFSHYTSIDAYHLPRDVRRIQRDIFLHGPVEADFLAYEDFPVYKSGVYQHVTGKLIGGHAIRLIGWGTENGVDYWLAANSWNNNWGENGTFKIRRGTNECGIEKNVIAGIPNLI